MSFFGRVFVVALFTASLIVWSLQAAEAIKGVVRYGIENRGPGSLRRMMIVAFLIVSYSTVMLYRGVMGWRRTLGLIVVLVVSICVVLCLMSLARYLINLWHPKLKESKLAG